MLVYYQSLSPSPLLPLLPLCAFFRPSRLLSRLTSRLSYISPSHSRSPLAASPGHPPSILNPIDPRIHTPYSILTVSTSLSVFSLCAPLFPLFPLFPLQVTTMHAQCPRPRSLFSPLAFPLSPDPDYPSTQTPVCRCPSVLVQKNFSFQLPAPDLCSSLPQARDRRIFARKLMVRDSWLQRIRASGYQGIRVWSLDGDYCGCDCCGSYG